MDWGKRMVSDGENCDESRDGGVGKGSTTRRGNYNVQFTFFFPVQHHLNSDERRTLLPRVQNFSRGFPNVKKIKKNLLVKYRL